MRRSWRTAAAAGDDRWVEALLEDTGETVHAPNGFSRKVMDAVYRESLAGRPSSAAAIRGIVPAERPSRPMMTRMYRRLGLSFMITAAVLTASLLLPHGAYPMLIGSGSDAVLGVGPSAAVQDVLAGARHAVQGALGERQIGGNQK